MNTNVLSITTRQADGSVKYRPSISRAYRSEGGGWQGENRALSHVLTRGWLIAAMHLPGCPECPWDFDADLFPPSRA